MSKVRDRPTGPLLDAVKDELARRDPSLAQALLDVLVSADEPDDLDPDVWGPTPSSSDVMASTVRAHRIEQQARAAVLATSLTRREAADRLGVGEQRVSRLVGDGELVALEDGGQLRLPVWQFHPDTGRGRLDGIGVVAVAYAGGPVTLTQWMERPNPALGARTPARALIEGDAAAVIAAARAGV